MDEDAQRLLEFGKITEILSRYAATAMGRKKAADLRPDPAELNPRRALQQTSEMAEVLRDTSLPLGGVEDVSRHARRAAAGGGPLEPAALWQIESSLETAQRIANWLIRRGGGYPALRALGQTMPVCPDLREAIRAAIDPGGKVKDDASPELKSIRRRITGLRNAIEKALRRIIGDGNVSPHLQYPNPTMCRDRYVLPVNAYHKNAVPGLVHGSSDSGATLYVEPMEVVEQGNELGEAIGEEEEEVQRILWELTGEVGRESEAIISTCDHLGRVDLVRAKARMSNALRMCEPELTSGRVLELRGARHPLLLWLTRPKEEGLPGEAALDFESVVPLDIRLGEDFDVLIITGPNTGGKTVVLKTLGLVCLMARAGMHVPAEKASVPLYHDIYVDIGDEQSLEQSLSTFSSHMSRIIRIIEEADERSLVLLDELGAGTDPAEGAALGEGILERLVNLGCSACVVTHLGRLKTFATARPGVENASVDFDIRTLRPTYRLRIGSAGSSNALEIADRLGLQQDILSKARSLLDNQSKGEYSSMLEEVELARADAEERRERMQYLEDQAEKLKEEYEEVLARLKAEDERRGAAIGLQLRDSLEDLHSRADALHKDIRNLHSNLAGRAAGLRDGLQKCLDDIEKLLAGHDLEKPLEEGDEVYVTKLHKWGTVERVDERKGRAQVRVGATRIDIETDKLQRWGEDVE